MACVRCPMSLSVESFYCSVQSGKVCHLLFVRPSRREFFFLLISSLKPARFGFFLFCFCVQRKSTWSSGTPILLAMSNLAWGYLKRPLCTAESTIRLKHRTTTQLKAKLDKHRYSSSLINFSDIKNRSSLWGIVTFAAPRLKTPHKCVTRNQPSAFISTAGDSATKAAYVSDALFRLWVELSFSALQADTISCLHS